MDITEEIRRQHEEQRHLFALLDETDRGDERALAALWSRLAALLEVHAEAEERHFYPALLARGTQAGQGEQAGGDTKDAVKDHNHIRDAVREARRHRVGTESWWQAVGRAREENSDHMAEEERDDLPFFRRHADLQTRHDLAVRFLVYEAEHSQGIRPEDKSPDQYVHDHTAVRAGGGSRR
jgi:iron-sulfur cluster repair protein YtfE (RIC family)